MTKLFEKKTLKGLAQQLEVDKSIFFDLYQLWEISRKMKDDNTQIININSKGNIHSHKAMLSI